MSPSALIIGGAVRHRNKARRLAARAVEVLVQGVQRDGEDRPAFHSKLTFLPETLETVVEPRPSST
jgi:hypothetical protein